MGKEKSVDVKIIGIVFIFLNLYFIIPALVLYAGNWPRLLAYSLWFLSGVGLLFLKNWARILSFFPMSYIILVDAIFVKALFIHKSLLAEVPLIVFIVFILIYLTRSSVKERFI